MQRRSFLPLPIALFAQAPQDLNLPDPLLDNGHPIRTPSEWTKQRRPAIIRLYEEHVYGVTPKPTRPTAFEVLEVKKDALNGLATRKRIRLFLLGDSQGPAAELLVYTPNAAKGRVPAFLGMNYLGNQSISTEPDIPVTKAWIRDLGKLPGLVNNSVNEESRGAQARRWPLEMILNKGYGVATLCYNEVEPDSAYSEKSILRKHFKQQPGYTGGTIGTWAYGLSRALDYLEKDKAIDARRVAVTGHSRLGKTALWAGALDTRFALVISNDSGEGGASLARRKKGERIFDSFRVSGFWYAEKYREYINREDDLPVDAHFLISLIAPRPVYVSSASEDVGADPEGEFLAARAANPVYKLFGREGLTIDKFPPVDQSFGNYVGYHVRTGIHDILAADWTHHLAFADKHLKK